VTPQPSTGSPPGEAPSRRRAIHPAVFGLLVMPFGVTVGYVTYAMPQVLHHRGFTMGEIGAVSALVSLPHAIKVGWAPALDAGWRRRSWYIASVLLAGLGLAVTQLIPPDRDARVTSWLTVMSLHAFALAVSQFGAATSSAAVDALMATTLPADRKDVAAGWAMAGNLGGTGLGGGLAMVLAESVSAQATAVMMAIACLVCGLPALRIKDEPPPRRPILPLAAQMAVVCGASYVAFADEAQPWWVKLAAVAAGCAALLKDVWPILRERAGWTGLMVCLSPVGTGALTNLFTALGPDFGATTGDLELTIPIAGGVISAGGCLLGGWLCSRYDKKQVYVVAGLATTVFALALAAAPAHRATFLGASMAYQLVNGVCYGSFAAFVLEIIGESPVATTGFSLFVSAANGAINYTTALDGAAYDWARARGMEGRFGMGLADACATYAGVAVLSLVMFVLVPRRRKASPVAA
jgi:PAT family beta-lactamase induction signal transducer AmpG